MRRRRPRAVGVPDVADEGVDQPLLIGRAELVADDLLRQRDRRGGHLAAQVFLRLLHLLLDGASCSSAAPWPSPPASCPSPATCSPSSGAANATAGSASAETTANRRSSLTSPPPDPGSCAPPPPRPATSRPRASCVRRR